MVNNWNFLIPWNWLPFDWWY